MNGVMEFQGEHRCGWEWSFPQLCWQALLHWSLYTKEDESLISVLCQKSDSLVDWFCNWSHSEMSTLSVAGSKFLNGGGGKNKLSWRYFLTSKDNYYQEVPWYLKRGGVPKLMLYPISVILFSLQVWIAKSFFSSSLWGS